MPTFAVHRYETDDLEAVTALLRSELPAEPITETAFARKVLLDPNFDPNGALVARDADNSVVGFLLALIRRRPLEDGLPDQDRGWITLFAVAAAKRRQGIGSALFDAAEQWLRGQGRTSVWISPYAPHYWTPGVDEAAYPEALVMLERRGYQVVMHPLSMDALLVGGWCKAEWIEARAAQLATEGVRFERFTPGHILPLTQLLRTEFPGDWQRYLRETMQEIVRGRRPADELLLAIQGERAIGFAQSEGERFGPFGVTPLLRGRGVGAVLLFRVLDGMRARGHHNAWFLWTSAESADRLYRAAGFRETRRYALLKKALD